ncbi:hypothetical protein BG005_005890 [Podila minutissima]|nr:hypothetical protein BG005_005890 [Podila minutissima]
MCRGVLRQCSVVGMTATRAAKLQELIKKLAPKTIICKGVGEHLILICDHKQLRSRIETYNLSLNLPISKKYNLDKSLFERLVISGKNSLPISILTIQ